jgi:acyl-CoA reductase-like NAD-dependent aldehyde dehydrogenase
MFKMINPATETVIHTFEEDGPDAIKEKYRRARSAQKPWADTPVTTRIGMMKKFREAVANQRERLAAILTSEVGKPIAQARNELSGVLGRIDFFIENVEKVMRAEVVFNDPAQKLEERIAHEPLGVIANISAWNYPWFVGSNVFVPALLTGNTVLYKPSEFATLTGLAIAELLYESGVPKDVFVPVIGGGAAGSELLKQPVNGVFFTGSYATGAKIAEVTARRMIKIQLELGGKDPAYVCEDVDVEAVAAATADGAFYNTGQSCCSVERIYVHERVYEHFVTSFLTTVKAFVIGNPTDEKTYIGPLTRSAHVGFIEDQVADALAKGAKLLTGGKRVVGKGFFFEPTVFVDVNHTMKLMRDESFGPIIGIQKVKDDAEALMLMNETDYGLTAAVYTTNAERAAAILSEVNSGSVYWNCCDRVSPRLPWSGRGFSGIGSTLSTYGILAFLQPKAWHMRRA